MGFFYALSMRGDDASLEVTYGGDIRMSSVLMMSAAEQGRAIAAGRVDPVELTEAYLEQMNAHADTSRIYACKTPERARAEAEAAQQRAKTGRLRSPLDGVPISWKDLFDSAEYPTEAGSALLAGRVPAEDAEVLANATAQGLVCLGKTHMSELAFSGLGLNPVTATPACINDAAAVAGGSSSGAAASIACDLAAGAIGSDTGGSVRIPAAWNDLVGLKTTAGRVSVQGVVPLCATFDTVGPLSKTVEDAALLLAALEGRTPADLTASSLRGKSLGILQTVAFDELREAPALGFETALAKVIKAGAMVEDIEIEAVSKAMPLSPILFASEAYGTWKTVIEAQPEVMFEEILNRFRGGADFAACDYIAASQMLAALRQDYLALTAGYDAILCPTAPILPPDAARLMEDADYYVNENLLALRNTRIGNLMGLCAITLPSGTPSCGLMLMGPPGAEEGLLRLAQAAEAAILA